MQYDSTFSDSSWESLELWVADVTDFDRLRLTQISFVSTYGVNCQSWNLNDNYQTIKVLIAKRHRNMHEDNDEELSITE